MPAKSPHVSDPSLAPFLRADFDPADYLNYTLPPLTNPSSLTSLSSETQSLLATLNAQATRLTQTLTQLTDEILRSGSRLAYQVDVLRGESTTLSETLSEKLADDISTFVPATSTHTVNGDAGPKEDNETYPGLSPSEPAHIARLRLLSDVRARLDSVIQLFGSAISWPAPPPASNSFISVAAPPASEADVKSKAYIDSLRTDLFNSISVGNEKEAIAQIEQLKTLLGLWKGTAEEKSREKVVSELSKLVDEQIQKQREAAGHVDARKIAERTRANSRAQQREREPQIHTGPFLDGLI